MKTINRRVYTALLSSMLLLNISPVWSADQVSLAIEKKSSGFDVNAIMGLNQNYDFKSSKELTLPNGVHKHKFTQYYLGIPVWGVSLSATKLDSGEYTQFSGNYLSNVETDIASVVPTMSKEDAFRIAMDSKKISPQVRALIDNKETKTYIWQSKDKTAHLVYEVSFMINGDTPSRPYFIIDATSGEILDQWEGLTTSKNAIGPGGNQKTGQYNYGTDYGYLIVSDTCQMSSPNVDTYDMKNLTSGGVLFQFDCSTNPLINTYKFTNGAFSPINDAHYFGNVVFNMYSQWFNTSPLTMKLKMRVHYSVNYENAFWDGQQMTFGDGYTRFYPLVSMDVVGHEVSHGFTQQHSNLKYSGQSGGINESFSDMAGEATEYFNNSSKPESERNDWLVGAQIFKTGVALRYFDDPTKDGRSIGNAKDYYDGLNVHYSSGVFNKAYYTLAKKANWTTEKAFRVFVLANQIYWNQSSDFINAACGAKKAAQDLGYSTQDVIDAFNVVGVDASCSGVPTCTHANPAVTISPASQESIPGGTLSYTVNVTNNDNAACSATIFNLAATVPNGFTNSLNQNSLNLLPGASGTTSILVTSSSSTTSGNYSFSVKAAGGATYQGTGSATYVVNPTQSSLSLTVSPQNATFPYNSKQYANFKFTLLNGQNPVPQNTVTVKFKGPNWMSWTTTLQTNSSGVAQYNLYLNNSVPVGSYSVTATAQYNGNTVSGLGSFVIQ